MLAGFFLKLKEAKIPVSVKEYLTLMEAMKRNVISPSIEEFYYLARMTLVKDEANFDKFDKAFGSFFHGIETLVGVQMDLPLEWLLKQAELHLSPEEKAAIEAMGGWEKLMETLKQRLEEQKERHLTLLGPPILREVRHGRVVGDHALARQDHGPTAGLEQ